MSIGSVTVAGLDNARTQLCEHTHVPLSEHWTVALRESEQILVVSESRIQDEITDIPLPRLVKPQPEHPHQPDPALTLLLLLLLRLVRRSSSGPAHSLLPIARKRG